jgi:hypothetical protein
MRNYFGDGVVWESGNPGPFVGPWWERINFSQGLLNKYNYGVPQNTFIFKIDGILFYGYEEVANHFEIPINRARSLIPPSIKSGIFCGNFDLNGVRHEWEIIKASLKRDK